MNANELGGRKMETLKKSHVLSRHPVSYLQKTWMFCIPRFRFKTLELHWVCLSLKLLSSDLSKRFQRGGLSTVGWAYPKVCFCIKVCFCMLYPFLQMWRSCPDWKRNITKCLWHIEDARNRNWREILRHAWRMSAAFESVSVLQWSMPCDFMRLLRKIRGNRKMLITSQEKQCSPLLTLMRSRTTHKILVCPRNFLTHDITQKEYHISLVQDVFFEFPISFR